MMDFYTGNGTEDGLSLQEMIECDMRSAMKYENLAHEGLGSLKSLDGLNVGMSMDFEIQGDSSNLSDKALNLGDLSWLQAVNVSQVLSPAENTDPNLLVDPQTGMPIGTLSGPSVTNTAAITVNTSQSQQTLNQVNTNVISTPRLHQQSNGLIQTNRGQFVTIPTTTSNTIPNTLTQNFVQQHQSPSSPSIRQHLQTVHHQHRNLASPNTHVVYQNGTPPQQQSLHSPQPAKTPQKLKNLDSREKVYPKPVYSYSCLIAMALKNSETGCLPVSEIYNFMTGNFPYFKTAPDGWKNSVRHNLSLNKCFEKIENPKSNGNTKKGCLWGMNPAKIEKMEEEIIKWRKKDPIAIKRSMAKPEVLELLEKGQGGCRSPAHSTHSSSSGSISTPSTPTSVNNNNITKVNRLPDTTSAIKTAVNNLSSITSINANINVIQIKPEVTNGMTVEQKAAEEVIYNNLTNDDLSILDNSLTLDPALNDLALQSGFFDDLANDDFNLDELPTSASPLSFSFTTPQGLSSSPLTIQTATAVQGIKEEKMDLSAFGNTIRISGAPSQTANGTTPGGNFLLSRTVSAFT